MALKDMLLEYEVELEGCQREITRQIGNFKLEIDLNIQALQKGELFTRPPRATQNNWINGGNVMKATQLGSLLAEQYHLQATIERLKKEIEAGQGQQGQSK